MARRCLRGRCVAGAGPRCQAQDRPTRARPCRGALPPGSQTGALPVAGAAEARPAPRIQVRLRTPTPRRETPPTGEGFEVSSQFSALAAPARGNFPCHLVEDAFIVQVSLDDFAVIILVVDPHFAAPLSTCSIAVMRAVAPSPGGMVFSSSLMNCDFSSIATR